MPRHGARKLARVRPGLGCYCPRVFLPVRHLVRRRGPAPDASDGVGRPTLQTPQDLRARAEEVAALRRRIASAPGATEVDPEERDAALEAARLRQALSDALGEVDSCRSCAKGHPLPHGRWSGGHCCGAATEVLFIDDEVAALRLSGTTPERLTPPADDRAGCAFRGPTGCALSVADRPNLCVRYLCLGLEAELRKRGDWTEGRALSVELGRVFDRFRRLRAERLARGAL